MNVVNNKKKFWFLVMLMLGIVIIFLIVHFILSFRRSNFIMIDDNVTLVLGDKISLSNKPNTKFEWSSTDDTIVKVDEYGFIEALNVGDAIIHVSYQGIVETCNVFVVDVEDAVFIEKLTLSDENITLDVGEFAILKYTIEPFNATNKNVTFYSSDPDVAIYEDGKIRALKSGNSVISVVTGDGIVASCNVEVKSKSQVLGEDKENNNINNNSNSNDISNNPNNDENNNQIIESQNNGNLVQSIDFLEEEIIIDKGSNYTLRYSILPNTVNTILFFNSSDKKIAIVDNNGIVIAKNTGTAIITVTATNGKSDTIKVIVKEPSVKIVDVESVSFDKSEVTLSVGDTLKIDEVIKPYNATYKNVIWSSGNENVAVVDDGLITAKWGGVATIMAKSNNGKTAKLKVIVKNYNLIFDDNNFLVTNGTKIVKKNNNKQVLLRGFNLGVWLSRSLAFMPVVPLANTKEELNSKGFSCINSESFLQALSKNPSVGSSGANKLSKILYDNFITEADLDLISQSGATVIRVPFEYNLLMNDNGTYKVDSNGNIDFYYLDWIVNESKKRGIYVILDLHLVPGRQNQGGWCDEFTFFKNSTYQNNVINMWSKVADHFKNEEAVAGYDIVNEPQANMKTLVTFYDKVYKSIRNVDKNHIIFMEETCVYCGYSGVNKSDSIGDLPNPLLVDSSIGKNNKWENVVYSTHDYFYDKDSNGEALYDTTLPSVVRNRMHEKTNRTIEKSKLYNIPYYIGEFSHLGNWSNYNNYLSVWKEAMTYYDNNNLNYTSWTYKGHWDRYFGNVFYGSNITKVNLETDSYSTIENVFKSGSSNALKFNKEFYLMFLEQWNGRLASGVILSDNKLSLNIGESKTINYIVEVNPNSLSGGYKTYDVINKKVIWSSSNPDVVFVDPNTGKMNAISSGTANITATLYPLMLDTYTVSSTCTVTVK